MTWQDIALVAILVVGAVAGGALHAPESVVGALVAAITYTVLTIRKRKNGNGGPPSDPLAPPALPSPPESD